MNDRNGVDLNYMFSSSENVPQIIQYSVDGHHGFVNQGHLNTNFHTVAPTQQVNNPNLYYSDHNYATAASSSLSTPEIHSKLDKLEKENVSLHTKVDILMKMVNEIRYSVYVENKNDQEISVFQKDLPLVQVEKIDELEKKLNNHEYFKKFRSVLRMYLGNRNEVGSGEINCYLLVDKLFDRSVLQLYTWTGTSKATNKLPFCSLKNIIRVFFEAIYPVDNSFSVKNVEKIFQNKILKYSKSRVNSKKIKPSTRKRTKGSKKNTTPETIDCENDEIDIINENNDVEIVC